MVLFTGDFGLRAGLGLPQWVMRVWMQYQGPEAVFKAAALAGAWRRLFSHKKFSLLGIGSCRRPGACPPGALGFPCRVQTHMEVMWLAGWQQEMSRCRGL